MPGLNRKDCSYQTLRALWRRKGIECGVSIAKRLTGATRKQIRYWVGKEFLVFCKVGGVRRRRFEDPSTHRLVCKILWTSAKLYPLSRIWEYRTFIKVNGFKVSASWISRQFTKWRWSFQKPDVKQIYKYTPRNLNHYFDYIIWQSKIPWKHLKFIDEAHFSSRDLLRQKAISRIGVTPVVINPFSLDERCSLTLMTSLDSSLPFPFILDKPRESNDQWDFADFVTYLCDYGFLVAGDFLIVDNAKVHRAHNFDSILRNHGVSIMYLELNPCELVWSKIKSYLRWERESDSFFLEIAKGASLVTYENMFNWYIKCCCHIDE